MTKLFSLYASGRTIESVTGSDPETFQWVAGVVGCKEIRLTQEPGQGAMVPAVEVEHDDGRVTVAILGPGWVVCFAPPETASGEAG